MSFNTPPLPRYKRQFRVFDELTSAEVERARAILVDCPGVVDPSVYMQRVVVADDGTYGITVYRPRVDDKRSELLQPSRENWLAAEPQWLPIVAGVAMLLSAENPELVIERRIRADADEAERVHLAEEAARKKQAEGQAASAARAIHREVELHGKEWDALPGWIRNNLLLAQIFDRNGMAEVAAEIRAGTEEGRRRVTTGSAAIARKVWYWPGERTPRKLEPEIVAAMEQAINEGPTEPVEGWWRK